MTSHFRIILLAATAALSPVALAADGGDGHRRITGRIELFPDGRIVRAPAAALPAGPAPGQAGERPGGPPAAIHLPATYSGRRVPGDRP